VKTTERLGIFTRHIYYERSRIQWPDIHKRGPLRFSGGKESVMKKILLINWRDIRNPEAGGAELYYHEIFRRLVSKGFSVTLLAHHFPGAAPRETIDGITVIRMGGKFLFNYRIIPFLLRNRNQFDLVIEDLNKIPFFTPLYLRAQRLHLAMHFFGTEIFREAPFPIALYVFLMEKIASIVYRKERFVAISESTSADIRRFPGFAGSIVVVEPGIDTSYFHQVRPKSSPAVIAYIGRLMKYKNIQFVIAALPVLQKRISGLTFEIGGTGDYLVQLRRIAQKHGVSQSVIFRGRISEEEKLDLLSRASLFVNPSAKEGWGINNIEANLCGTVSLSADVPGLRDSVIRGETGMLYRPGDTDDFCALAIEALTNHDLRGDMERSALKRARSLDWNIISEKMAVALS